jgi:tRNA (adenine37-N6)-methyltransferase
MQLLYEPIGEVRCRTLLVGQPWGAVFSELHSRGNVAAGLRGIDQFSHLLVLFCMHEASYRADRDLVRRPGGRHSRRQAVLLGLRPSKSGR